MTKELGFIEQMIEDLIRPTIREVLREEIHKIVSTLGQNEKPVDVELLSASQAEKFLGICRTTLNTYVRDGIVPAHRLGGVLRFKKTELEESLDKVRTLKGTHNSN